MRRSPLRLRETLGLTREAPAQAALALRGDPSVPPSRFGLSSLQVYTPRLGVATWLGRRLCGRTVPVPNLYNHTPTPIDQGWSVRVTQVRDFRGRRLTYDSHNGTDFAVPPGTLVVPSAPGRVVALRSEYHRGGLKLYVDHGRGLLTSYHHLGRALVRVGDRVERGQPIALSGYSGLDALVSFPWVAPHVHYNVTLGGALVDPFAGPGQRSLWAGGANSPRPGQAGSEGLTPTRFTPAAVQYLLDDLRHPARQAALAAIHDPYERAWQLVIEATTFPTRFASPAAAEALFGDCPRQQRLDLPFSADEWDDVAFADDLGLRRA